MIDIIVGALGTAVQSLGTVHSLMVQQYGLLFTSLTFVVICGFLVGKTLEIFKTGDEVNA